MSIIKPFAADDMVSRENINKKINEVNVKINENNPTLAHAKTGTAHNLTGTIPASGLVCVNFIPIADYADDDTISVNNVSFASYNTLGDPVSGFKTGIPVSAVVNIEAKIITISGGGGGMKMVQQLELPLSDKYEEAVPEPSWSMTSVTGQPTMQNSTKENGVIYSVIRENVPVVGYRFVLYKQNIASKAFTRTEFTDQSSYPNIVQTVIYNHEVYVVTGDSSLYSYQLFKLNEETKTTTYISALGNRHTTSYGSGGVRAYQINNDMLILFYADNYNSGSTTFGSFQCYYYIFSTNTLSSQSRLWGSDSSRYPTSPITHAIQKNSTGDKFRTMVYAGNTQQIIEFNLTTKTFSTAGIFTPWDNKVTSEYVECVQVADKLMYITQSIHFAGKRTGEIDLFNVTMDPLKYPEVSVAVAPNYFNIHLVEDKIIMQSTEKLFSLRLVPRQIKDLPIVMYMQKGDVYNAPFINEPIEVLPIESIGQAGFTITNMPQIMAFDAEIHDRQYALRNTPAQLLIKRG